MSSPDPAPEQTPGLEPGGGVPPGETPPAAESASWGAERPEAPPGRIQTPVWLIAIAIVVLAVILFVIGKAASLF